MYKMTVYYETGSGGLSELFYDDTAIDEQYVVLDPVLTLEESSAGKLTFTVPPTNVAFEYFYGFNADYVGDAVNSDLATRVRVTKGTGLSTREEVVWEGRVTSREVDFWKCIKVTCEGILAVLNDTIQPPNHYQNITPRTFLEALLNIHNGRVGDNTRKIFLGNVTVPTVALDSTHRYTDYETTLNCIIEKLVKNIGGRIVTRFDNNHWVLDYLWEYNEENSQTIEFGSNLFDYSTSMHSEDYCTVCVPRGKKLETGGNYEALPTYTTVASVNGGSIYVSLTANDFPSGWQGELPTELYGSIEKVVDWNDVENPSLLLSKAKTWLKDKQFSNMELEVSAMDLHYSDPSEQEIKLGDTLRVISLPHGLNRLFPVTKMEIKLNTPEDTLFTLGSSVKVSLTSSSKNNNQQIQNQFAQIPTEQHLTTIFRQEAADMIEAATMGYINIIKNPQTGAEEFVVSNEPNYLEADKIWRWTIGGLGFSNQGYNSGSYSIALTADGRINADLISTGTLIADIIRAGILTDQSGNNNFWFNLTTGEYSIRAIQDIIDGTSQYVTMTQLNQTAASISLNAAATYSRIDSTAVVNLLPQTYVTYSATPYGVEREAKAAQNGQEVSLGYRIRKNADGSLTYFGTTTSGGTTYTSVRFDLSHSAIDPDLGSPVILDPNKQHVFSLTSNIPFSETSIFGRIRLFNIVPYSSSNPYYYESSITGTNPVVVLPSGWKYAWVSINVCVNPSYTFPSGGATVYPMLEVGTVAHPFVSPVGNNNIQTNSLLNAKSDILSAQAAIEVNATNIQSKVSLTDYTGATIASKINQSATSVVIEAAHISLAGKTINLTSDNIVISSTKFSVTKDGVVTATGANISGTITASAGSIGGFTIDATSIRTSTLADNANNSVALSKNQFQRTVAGASRTGLMFAIGSNFGVNYSGVIYATNANITGTITSTNATITGGTIIMNTSSKEEDKIQLNYTGYKTSMQPQGIDVQSTALSTQVILNASGIRHFYQGEERFNIDTQGRIYFESVVGGSRHSYLYADGSKLATAENAYGDVAQTGRDLSSSSNKSINTATVGNITSITIPTTGKWMIFGHANFPSNSVGYRKAYIADTSNGTTAVNDCCAQVPAVNGSTTVLSFSTEVKPSSANTTYYLNVYQTSGGSLSITGRLFAVRIA